MKQQLYLVALFLLFGATQARAGELSEFVARPEPAYHWAETARQAQATVTEVTLTLDSQEWQGRVWSHTMRVFIPKQLKNKELGFIFVTGKAEGDQALAEEVAKTQGIVAAVLGNIPNQPLFGDLTEDRLIAYTFDQYRKTEDPSWPLLFPMVKSVVKAMDALTELGAKEGLKTSAFVISGASKRGWTTWLTAAADTRVRAIAPIVFDMLNMKAQVDWAVKSYGGQSEKLRPYTELGLVRDIDTPEIRRLRESVDPYSYLPQLSMPKLVLLGANDPYWTVDAQQHYFPALVGSKQLYLAPNFGHKLAESKTTWQTLESWLALLVSGSKIPELSWKVTQTAAGGAGGGGVGSDSALLHMSTDTPLRSANIWIATSATRDFRQATWEKTSLPAAEGKREIEARVASPAEGFLAFIGEAVFQAGAAEPFTVSTEVKVLSAKN